MPSIRLVVTFIFLSGGLSLLLEAKETKGKQACRPYDLPTNSRWLNTGCDEQDRTFQCENGYSMVINTSCKGKTLETDAICQDIDDIVDEIKPYNHNGKIDPCMRNPCNNGGTCTRIGDSFTCACPLGFNGTLCEDIDHCRDEPCLHNGICIDGIDSYSCNCAKGYMGQTCKETIDPCRNNPCNNGGTCTRFGDNFTCACPPGFNGSLCQDCGLLLKKYISYYTVAIYESPEPSSDGCEKDCSKRPECNAGFFNGRWCSFYRFPVVEAKVYPSNSSERDCIQACSTKTDCTAFSFGMNRDLGVCLMFNTSADNSFYLADTDKFVSGFKSCEKLFLQKEDEDDYF